MKGILFLLAGGALLTVGQGHLPFGPAAIAGLALVALAFRSGRASRLIPVFVIVHVVMFEVAYRGMVPMDLGPRLGMAVGIGLMLGGIFALDALVWRSRSWGTLPASLVLPSGLVLFDLLSARLSPGASWGSLAYSFVDPLPVVQVVSVVGWTGLTFLAAWSASFIAAAPEAGAPALRRRLAIVAGVLLLVVGGGWLRIALAAPQELTTLKVANLVAPSTYGTDDETLEDVWAYTRGVDVGEASRERAKARIEASLDEHLSLATQAFDAGARLVAFAEANASLTPAELPHWVQRTGVLASERDGWIALGLSVFRPDAGHVTHNQVIVVGPGGEVDLEFLKATRTPGDTHAVRDAKLPTADFADARFAGAICFDLDFPHLFAGAGARGVDVILAPSNDWSEAAVSHARMARVRAVEQGVALWRPTKDGLSLVADRYGRTLASQDTLDRDQSLLLAELPIAGSPTVYSRIGDAFAWLCVAGFVLLVGRCLRRRR